MTLSDTLVSVALHAGSGAATDFFRALPEERRMEPDVYSTFYTLVRRQYAETSPVAILIPDSANAPDITAIIETLYSEHYRVRIYTNLATAFWGDEGQFEIWPVSFISSFEHEVLITLGSEQLLAAKALGAKYYFHVDFNTLPADNPRAILQLIYPSWDRDLLRQWHDRFARRRVVDYQLPDTITRISYITDKLRALRPASLCEVGCWCGDFTYRLKEFDFIHEICCVDISNESVLRAAARVADAPKSQNYYFSVGWAEELPLPDKSVDMILIAEVLEHVLDLDKALSECRRVARKWVLGSVPNYIETNIGHARIVNPSVALKGEAVEVVPYTDNDPRFGGWNFLWTL